MNIKKRISALAMATTMMVTSIPIGVSAGGYINPTKRAPKDYQGCENVVLSSHGVDFYQDDIGNILSQGDKIAWGVPIPGNPEWAAEGADVVRKYTKLANGAVRIDACSNIKVTDTYVKDSDNFDVAATGIEARNELANANRMTKNEDHDTYKIKDTHKNILPETRVKTITKPQNGKGPMSTQNIPKDRVRVCSETIVSQNDVSKASDNAKLLTFLGEQGIKDPSKLSNEQLDAELAKFSFQIKNSPNSATVMKKLKELNHDELRNELKALKSGKDKGRRVQNIDVALTMNCKDKHGDGPGDPGKPPKDGDKIKKPDPPTSGTCLDSDKKGDLIDEARGTECWDNCGDNWEKVTGYETIIRHPGTIVGETILAQYRQDYKSTPKYKTFAYCPNQDNVGWKFWDESPFSNSLGDTKQSDNYLEYMSGDKKDWAAMNNAWKTHFEERGVANYQNDGLRGKNLANWLEGNQSYVFSGLPTYHGSTYIPQFEQINPGVNPPAKQPDSSNLGDHPGMSPLEHGWWQGYSSDGKFDIDKFHNDTEAPIAIDVTEDGDVSSHLGKNRFIDQPMGRFKIAWIDQYLGYKRNGAPVWNTGSNITRRCQQEFQALVKYPREHYKNIIKNGYSTMYIYKPQESYPCKYKDWRGRCMEYCRKCTNKLVGTYTVDCYAYKSCQNTKPGDGASKTAIPVTHDSPGYDWDVANALLAKYMRGDDRPGTNMVQKATYGGIDDIITAYGKESCEIDFVTDAKYNPGRSWNYRDRLNTEYHGYLVPPTTPDGGEDPRFPGIPENPGDEIPNSPGSGKNPPGNILIPFVGKDKGKPGSSGGSSSTSTRNRDNYIKSGYGVTYEAGVKFYSDFGRDGENIVAKFIGDKSNREPSQGSVLYRPRRTDNIPINDNQAAFQRVVNSVIKNNPDVPTTTSRGLVRPTQSSAMGGKELYIWDHAVRTRYNRERYIPYPNSIIEPNGSGGVEIPGIEGQGYAWKQKSGLGVTYGTDVGYFHADPSTKLYRHLIPGLDQSRQHFIHLDYPNGVYSIGSIAQIGMFRSDKEVFKTKMGNYANIEVRGNMYEDSYTAPDNPYLNKEDVGGNSKKVNYNWNK